MAPRRNVKNSTPEKEVPAALPRESLPRGRLPKTKTLKVSKAITVKVPNKKSSVEAMKKVYADAKIALANEVARLQLLKKPVDVPPDPTPFPTRRTRNTKTVVSKFFENSDVKNDISAEPPNASPKIVKKVTKKSTTENPPIARRVLTRKRVADTTEQNPNLKLQKLASDSVVSEVPKETKVDTEVETSSKADTTTKDISEDKPENKSNELSSSTVTTTIRRKKILKGKKDNVVDNNDKSPILQTRCVKSPLLKTRKSLVRKPRNCSKQGPRNKSARQLSTINIKDADTSQIQPGPIGSRKNSVSSISNLSWTRDISSSSTTTCHTVSSKDIVRIDKRLPVVKLTTIDSKIDKYKSKVDEDSSSDDSSSTDSEPSAFNKSALLDVQLSLEPTLGETNILNLSTSSLNSTAIQAEDRTPKLDGNKQNYNQAAENLMHALKKIDMEFINWINETDYVTTDLNRIKDKLFDILNNEFCAISHCQKLQNISKLADVDFSNIDDVEESHEYTIDDENKHPTVTNDKSTVTSDKIENNTKVSEQVSQSPKNKRVQHNAVDTENIESNPGGKDIDEPKEVENDPCRTGTDNYDSVNHNWPGNCDIESQSRDEFSKPSTSGIVSNKFNRKYGRHESEGSSSDSTDFTKDVNISFGASTHDDDDALSLFAESITGIESSRLNMSVLSPPPDIRRIEEYVPEPVQNNFISPKNYSYFPTKIHDQSKNGAIKIICEKQNADSTSIHREPINVGLQSNHVRERIATQDTDICAEGNIQFTAPFLLADLYKLRPKETNIIFKGYCFFNIFKRCYNVSCKFSHVIPDVNDITPKLPSLTQEEFMKEYLLLRRNNKLMIKYGKCFLQECVRRQLTRMLVEMAMDFIKNRVLYRTVKVHAVEITLMHLNNVDLSVCEDILRLKVHENILLCDTFMSIMTSTQNFSRFKPVFLNLTYFMVNNDRTFSLKVAEQILERVCILPFDESVVRAVIQIMRLTSPEIFVNSLTKHFEKHISVSSELMEEYVSVKKEIDFESLARRVAEQVPAAMLSPQLATTVDQSARPDLRDGVPLPPSPDTTLLDNMNKPASETMEPIITRTLRGFGSPSNPHLAIASPSSSNNEEIVKTPNLNNWRHRSIFQQISRPGYSSPRQPMRHPPRMLRPPNRPMRKRQFMQRLVTLGGSPIGYPRPGPDY